jgi:hypothetical protein
VGLLIRSLVRTTFFPVSLHFANVPCTLPSLPAAPPSPSRSTCLHVGPQLDHPPLRWYAVLFSSLSTHIYSQLVVISPLEKTLPARMTMDLDECLLDNDRLRHGLRLANALPDADGLAAQIHTRLPDLLFKFDMLQTNLLTHDRIDAPATARCCARSYLDCGLCCAVIPTFQTHKCCVGRVGNLAKYRLISVISTRYTLASSRASISRLSTLSTSIRLWQSF